jgi:hypothetical protein
MYIVSYCDHNLFTVPISINIGNIINIKGSLLAHALNDIVNILTNIESSNSRQNRA